MDPTVGTFLGYTVGLGMLVSVVTQIIKTVDTIPYLNKIPGAQKLIDVIASGNKEQVRIFVALLALGANAVSVYINNGEIVSVQTLIATFTSFLTALGTYDLVLKGEAKTEEN